MLKYFTPIPAQAQSQKRTGNQAKVSSNFLETEKNSGTDDDSSEDDLQQDTSVHIEKGRARARELRAGEAEQGSPMTSKKPRYVRACSST